MLETLQKKSRKAIITRMIIAFIIMAGCLIYCGKGLIQFFQGPVSIKSADDLSKYEGKYVSYDVELLLDPYVEETSRNTKTNVTRTTALGFVVYDYKLDLCFGYRVKTSDNDLHSDIIDASYSAYNEGTAFPESFQIRGTLKALKGTELNYYQSTTSEIFGDRVDSVASPFYIDSETVDGKEISIVFVVSAAALIALLYIIYNFMKLKNNGCLKQFNKYLEKNPSISIASIESDFNSAEQVGKNWVGKKWLIFLEGSNVKILDMSQLVWAYYYRRTGRHPESKIITFDINKNQVSFDVSSSESDIVLQNWSINQPHMMLGYDEDLKRTFNKDFETFLNLKYNVAKSEQSEQTESAYTSEDFNF